MKIRTIQREHTHYIKKNIIIIIIINIINIIINIIIVIIINIKH